jgi:protein involved in polysaccharide export with SLBB domain
MTSALIAALVGLLGIGPPIARDLAHGQDEAVFFVEGEVQSPGRFRFAEESITVLRAIAMAGGLRPSGSTRNIVLRRSNDGTQIEIPAKLNDVIRPGDTVVVRRRAGAVF